MALALVIYGLLALRANWPEYPGDPNLIRAGDLSLDTWLLAWNPHALLHGQNLLATNYVNYPAGANLAQDTSMTLLGLLATPLTLLVSPVSTTTLLLWLSPTLSAGAMCFVLRRFVRHDFAAFLGGLLYGFSSYMVCVQGNHLHLAFVPLPPLILYVAYKVFRDCRWRDGVLLGLLVTAQMYISSEVAATVTIMGGCAALVFGAHRPKPTWLGLRRAVGPLALGAVITIVISIPYIQVLVSGPYRITNPTGWIGGRMADLLSPVLPTSLEKFGPTSWKMKSDLLVQGSTSEDGAYLGIPLILLLISFTIYLRRSRAVVSAFVLVIIALIFSFGIYLQVDSHLTSIWLPDHLLLHAPIFQDLIPVRLALYEFLFAAVIVAIGFDTLMTKPRRWVPFSGFTLLGVATVLSLIPAWPAPVGPTNVPAYFTSSAVKRVPQGAIVMMTPYVSSIDPGPSIYLAMAKFRFRMVGGYGMFSDHGNASTNPAFLTPEDVPQYISAQDTDGAQFINGMPIPKLSRKLACDTRTFLKRNGIQVVLATDEGDDPAADRTLFIDAIGAPQSTSGATDQWYNVRQILRAVPPRHLRCLS
jgi:hypothetical protein